MNRFLRIIFFILIIAAIAGLFYWGYLIIKERYFAEPKKSEVDSEISNELNKQNGAGLFTNGDLKEPGEITESDELKNENEDQDKNTGTESPIVIDSDDCNNECEGFTGNNLEYCWQVCGLAAPRDISGNCDNLSGLEKDYCLKDLAISKKDFKICEEIKDSAIKKTCKNRVTEDILDEEI